MYTINEKFNPLDADLAMGIHTLMKERYKDSTLSELDISMKCITVLAAVLTAMVAASPFSRSIGVDIYNGFYDQFVEGNG